MILRLVIAFAGAAAITASLFLGMHEVADRLKLRDPTKFFTISNVIVLPGSRRPSRPRSPERPPERSTPDLRPNLDVRGDAPVRPVAPDLPAPNTAPPELPEAPAPDAPSSATP